MNPRGWLDLNDLRTCFVQVALFLFVFFTIGFSVLYLILRR